MKTNIQSIVQDINYLNKLFSEATKLLETNPNNIKLKLNTDSIEDRLICLKDELKCALNGSYYQSIVIHLLQEDHHKMEVKSFLNILSSFNDFLESTYNYLFPNSKLNLSFVSPINESYGILLIVDEVQMTIGSILDNNNEVSCLFREVNQIFCNFVNSDDLNSSMDFLKNDHKIFVKAKEMFKYFSHYQNNIEIELNPIVNDVYKTYIPKESSKKIYKFLRSMQSCPDLEIEGKYRILGISKLSNKLELIEESKDDTKMSFTCSFSNDFEDVIFTHRINDIVDLVIIKSSEIDETDFVSKLKYSLIEVL